ncbi:hypothetical protein FD754_013987 [Muntiacus muntjak]|uniref:Mos1 transposase HTH domain-containing protein n=1 Tax=Muntiacus muntjak TaxID=9888 RepID=A0A5N3VIJ0_MUNMU|nr:hypothetical protein FD754_013987 [Muntiacus muntjak]
MLILPSRKSASKWVIKAAETTCNISNAFGPGTANKHTVQWWFKKFSKGDESLEDEECRDQPSEVDNDQLRGSLKLIILQLHKKLPKNSVNHSTVLNKWVSRELGKNKKYHHFEVSTVLRNNKELFLNRIVMCDEKWILYNNQRQPAQLLDQEEAPLKHFPKLNLHKKKLIHYSFLNPRETITSGKYAQQINEMHQKWQGLWLALVNRKGLTLLHNARPHFSQPTLQKLNKLGCKDLPHPPYLPDPSNQQTTAYFFKYLDNFLQEKCFHSQQEAENAFQEFDEARGTDFYAIGINKLIYHW